MLVRRGWIYIYIYIYSLKQKVLNISYRVYVDLSSDIQSFNSIYIYIYIYYIYIYIYIYISSLDLDGPNNLVKDVNSYPVWDNPYFFVF